MIFCCVEEVRAEHVKLSWEAPDDDGGTPVVRYLIKIMDLDYSQWINAAEVKPWYLYYLVTQNMVRMHG